MKKMHPISKPLSFIFLTFFIACGGDAESSCPNKATPGQGVQGETCNTHDDCGCNLYCITGACAMTGDATNSADAAPQDIGYVKESYYKFTITLPSGDELVFDRDLTGDETSFSFGSTHIAPAISFAMTDTVYDPDYSILTLNFGIIHGSGEYPVQCDGPGEYTFYPTESPSRKPGSSPVEAREPGPPEIVFFLDNNTYTSVVNGASGIINVTDWSKYEGDVFAGTIDGTLYEKSLELQGESLQISGLFHFILPSAGQ
jgi:hypothetical protein